MSQNQTLIILPVFLQQLQNELHSTDQIIQHMDIHNDNHLQCVQLVNLFLTNKAPSNWGLIKSASHDL